MANYVAVQTSALPLEIRTYSLYFNRSDNDHVGDSRDTCMLIAVSLMRRQGQGWWRWEIGISSEPVRRLINRTRLCPLCDRFIGRRSFVTLMDRNPRGPLKTQRVPWNRAVLPRCNKTYLCHTECFEHGVWYRVTEVMNG